MADDFDVPLGTPSKLAYLVRLDEDVWLRYSDADRKACQELWREEAEHWNDVPGYDIRIVCLQLIPDPLFPSTDKTKPYVGWQYTLKRRDDKHYGVLLTVTLDSAFYAEILPSLRVELMREFAQYPKGTRYQVMLDTGQVLDQGRIA
jgi:hypothetical protein